MNRNKTRTISKRAFAPCKLAWSYEKMPLQMVSQDETKHAKQQKTKSRLTRSRTPTRRAGTRTAKQRLRKKQPKR